MSFLQGQERMGESMGGGLKKLKQYCDGHNSYRSHAFAHRPLLG